MAELAQGGDQASPCGAGAVLTIPLTETSPGVYETWFNLPADLQPGIYDLVGCLTVGGGTLAVQPPAVLIVLAAPPAGLVPLPPPGIAAGAAPPVAIAPPAEVPITTGPPPPLAAPPPTVTVQELQAQPGAFPAAPGGTDGLPSSPSWAAIATRSVPAGELWVTPDDMIVVGVRSSLAGVALTLAARLWGPDGQFAGGSTIIRPPGDRSLNFYVMPLSYGYLIQAAVLPTAGNPARGQTLVSVGLARGPVASFLRYAILAQDYVTDTNPVGWPPGGVVPGTSRPGYTADLKFATGAQAVPTGARWQVQWVQGNIVTSATVKTRWARLTYIPPQTNATDFEVMSAAGIPASTNGEVYFIRGLGQANGDQSLGLGSIRIATPLPEVEGFEGGSWQASWYNQDAGNDSPGFWYLFYEETLEDG